MKLKLWAWLAHHVDELHGAAIRGQSIEQQTASGTGTRIENQISCRAHNHKPLHVPSGHKLAHSQTVTCEII